MYMLNEAVTNGEVRDMDKDIKITIAAGHRHTLKLEALTVQGDDWLGAKGFDGGGPRMFYYDVSRFTGLYDEAAQVAIIAAWDSVAVGIEM